MIYWKKYKLTSNEKNVLHEYFFNNIDYYVKHQYRNIANVSNITLFSFLSQKLRDPEYVNGQNFFFIWGVEAAENDFYSGK